MLEQLQPCDHMSGPPHERLEQRELLRRQLHLRVAAPDPSRRRIETKVADNELRGPLNIAASRQCAQSGEELGERERLREVVVRPGVEPGDAVLDGVPRCEHQYGRPDTSRTQLTARLE